MIRPFDAQELKELVVEFSRPGIVAEIAILVGCLLAAWIVVRLIRGRSRPVGSVWFGNRIVDGVLFPVLALAFAYAARIALAGVVKPAVFKVAIPILLSLVVIRLSARVLRRTFPGVRWVRIVERSISWLAWIAVVLWITGFSPMVLDAMEDVHWKVGNTQMTLRNVFEGAITAGIVLVLALWVSAAIEKKLLSNGSGHDLSLRKIAANVVRAVLLFFGLLIALSAVGIDLTALSFLGGAIGVGLGFGLQKIAANYISGFVILAERSLRIGDMVKVDTFEGRITDIRTRYTIIRSLSGREAIVPNETLITTRVENLVARRSARAGPVDVQVAYGSDVRALQPMLEQAIARGAARHRRSRRPAVQLAAFSADGMELADQLLDPRSRERPGQRQVRRQPRGARGAESRRRRDSVPAARRPRRRLGEKSEAPAARIAATGGRRRLSTARLKRSAAARQRAQVQVQRAHVDFAPLLERRERHDLADAAAVGTLAGLEHRHELLGGRCSDRARCPGRARAWRPAATTAALPGSCRRRASARDSRRSPGRRTRRAPESRLRRPAGPAASVWSIFSLASRNWPAP